MNNCGISKNSISESKIFSKLVCLEIACNNLNEFDIHHISELRTLELLNINNCGIKSRSLNLANLRNLITLKVSYNTLDRKNITNLCTLHNLKYLEVINCNVLVAP